MHSPNQARAQSAMEYLMTYGWAILVILVVLGILYLLHVFSPGSLLGTTCIVNFKYFCQNPTLSTNGMINVIVGQNTDGSFYDIAVACTAAVNSTTGGPYTANGISPWWYVNESSALSQTFNASSTLTLNSGDKLTVNGLPCYSTTGLVLDKAGFGSGTNVYSFTSNTISTTVTTSTVPQLQIGTPFSGILWIEYAKNPGTPGTSANPWIIAQIASVTVSVSAAAITSTTTSTTSISNSTSTSASTSVSTSSTSSSTSVNTTTSLPPRSMGP